MSAEGLQTPLSTIARHSTNALPMFENRVWSFFAYDNNTFIVESFLDQEVSVTVSTTGHDFSQLKNLVSGELIQGVAVPARRLQQMSDRAQRVRFQLHLKPHGYLAFAETV